MSQSTRRSHLPQTIIQAIKTLLLSAVVSAGLLLAVTQPRWAAMADLISDNPTHDLAIVKSSIKQPEIIHSTSSGSIIHVDDTVNDGLAAHWKFDGVGLANECDVVSSVSAALQNGANIGFGPVPPTAFLDPGVLALDGVDDRVQIPDAAALDLAASFSVVAWVRRGITGTYDAIYDSGNQSNQWWVFIADGSAGKDNKLGFGERGISEVYSTQPITDANWHHIAVVKNGNGASNLTFYVDGQVRGTSSVGSVTTPSGVKYVGILSDTIFAAPFGGNIDDLRIYDRALTLAEVQRLAQGYGCVFDGSSWAQAMRDLQCALSEASTGDDIWVAAGTYLPSLYRFTGFSLRNGVSIYGGFTGTESALNQRPAFDANAPLTILSGDIKGDDVPATLANYNDNSTNVIVALSSVTATLDGLQIRGGNADGLITQTIGNGGGLYIKASSGSVKLNNVSFFANQTANQGGGMFSQIPIQMTGTTFISNSADFEGGGLFMTSTARLTNTSFFSNSAEFGGAVGAADMLTITGGRFQNNRATSFDGGAIDTDSSLFIDGVSFIRNQAGFSGGAIAGGLELLAVSNSTFDTNQVNTFSGGAIESIGPLNVRASIFLSNTSRSHGGAIEVIGGANIVSSTFQNNQTVGSNCSPTCTSGDGGAIFAFATLTLTDSSLLSNTARLSGGAVEAQGTATIESNTFISNTAGTDGGGFIAHGSWQSADNLFSHNNATRFGGAGVLLTSTLTNDRYIGNQSGSEGGALRTSGDVTITHAYFEANLSYLSGAIVHDTSGRLIVADSLFASNNITSSAGGAVMRLFDSSIYLINDTLVDSATNPHPAIGTFRTSISVSNTIFTNHSASVNADISSTLTYDYNLFFNVPLPLNGVNGGHNQTVDPKFVDAAASDFHLLAGSPAIDAGLDAAVPAYITTDLDGLPRFRNVVHTIGSPRTVDMGAYEFQPLAVYLPLVLKNH